MFDKSSFVSAFLFRIKKADNLRETKPNNNNEAVSTNSIDTCTNHEFEEKLKGIILKKFTKKNADRKVLPIRIKKFSILNFVDYEFCLIFIFTFKSFHCGKSCKQPKNWQWTRTIIC